MLYVRKMTSVRKIVVLKRSNKQHHYSKKKTLHLRESNTADTELLEELKLMRLDLTGPITKLSDDLKDFQRNINDRKAAKKHFHL